MAIVLALLFGLIFGAGIVISGMANPAKILNFFDVTGTWDPSLAFVMGGALAVTAIGYALVFRSKGPRLGGEFRLPGKSDLDAPLLIGSALFGVGWGIAGFCPGGSVPALGLFKPDALIFVLAMCAGIIVARKLRQRFQ